MAEITLIEAFISEQVITEVSRNLKEKMPDALPVFHRIVHRCVQVIPDPSLQDVEKFTAQADWKDAPILAAAVNTGCRYLLTYNVRDYRPMSNDISILQPGKFIKFVRNNYLNWANSNQICITDTKPYTSTFHFERFSEPGTFMLSGIGWKIRYRASFFLVMERIVVNR